MGRCGVVLAITVFAGSACSRINVITDPRWTRSDGPILEVVLRSWFWGNDDGRKGHVLVDREPAGYDLRWCCNAKQLHKLLRPDQQHLRQSMVSLGQDCCVASKRRATLEYLEQQPWIKVVEGSKLPPIPDGGRWWGLVERFPNAVTGLVRLSAPAYSRDRKLGAVAVSWTGGSETGEGRFYLLYKDGAEWKVLGWARTYVS